MEIFKISLLILAYTIGIITISLQVICYLKKIEYKETLFLSISFLLLIASTTITEFSLIAKNHIQLINEYLFYFFNLMLGLSVSLNIHKERIIKNERFKNRILLYLTLLVFLVLTNGFFFGFRKFAEIAVLVFLYSSIAYTMVVIIKEKPSLLVKHRDKEEKITARFFLYFFSTYSVIGLLNTRFAFMPDSLFDGPIILSVIFIGLALSKLTDDLKRLTLFSPQNKYVPDKLSIYNISPREIEVLNLLVQGISYKDIAEKLFISLPTVKTHVSNIYQKMKINNKIELINLLND
jgi:DNA-binding CsgD family transcriptional regulator